jgi:hypothetical protein
VPDSRRVPGTDGGGGCGGGPVGARRGLPSEVVSSGACPDSHRTLTERHKRAGGARIRAGRRGVGRCGPGPASGVVTGLPPGATNGRRQGTRDGRVPGAGALGHRDSPPAPVRAERCRDSHPVPTPARTAHLTPRRSRREPEASPTGGRHRSRPGGRRPAATAGDRQHRHRRNPAALQAGTDRPSGSGRLVEALPNRGESHGEPESCSDSPPLGHHMARSAFL